MILSRKVKISFSLNPYIYQSFTCQNGSKVHPCYFNRSSRQEELFPQQVLGLEIPDLVEELVLDPIVLIPSTQEDEVLDVQGQVFLEGSDSHEEIVVRARIGGSLVATTLTDE